MRLDTFHALAISIEQRQHEPRPSDAFASIKGLIRCNLVQSVRSVIVERRHEIGLKDLRDFLRNTIGAVQVFDVASTGGMPTPRHDLAVDQLHLAKQPVLPRPSAEKEHGLVVVLARQFHGSGYIAADANSARRNHGARQAVGAKIASTRHLGRLRNVARRALMREPDKPEVLCCGEADAYWADAFEATSDGQ